MSAPDPFANAIAALLVYGTPVVTLALALLPYGRRFILVNGLPLALVSGVVMHEMWAGPPDQDGVYRMLIGFYGALLSVWFAVVHGAKGLVFVARRTRQRRHVLQPARQCA